MWAWRMTENSYNGHSIVVRMSHDQSLVARIDLNHDVVTDCPGPKRVGAAADSSERTFLGEQLGDPVVGTYANSNNYFRTLGVHQSVDAKVSNATAVGLSLGGGASREEQGQCDVPWQNSGGIIAASVLAPHPINPSSIILPSWRHLQHNTPFSQEQRCRHQCRLHRPLSSSCQTTHPLHQTRPTLHLRSYLPKQTPTTHQALLH